MKREKSGRSSNRNSCWAATVKGVAELAKVGMKATVGAVGLSRAEAAASKVKGESTGLR